MYYWRFRRSLLTPGFDRKVNEHQRLCTAVQGLFSFSSIQFLQYYYWSIFVYVQWSGIVNSSNLFYINPQVYVWWSHKLAGQQCSHYRFYPYGFTCVGYKSGEANRGKIKTKQAVYFQASIDAQVRCQHRYATGYRRRVF